MLLASLLKSLIHHGELTVIDAHGRVHRFAGDPMPPMPDKSRPRPVTIRLHDPRLHTRLFFRPTLATGEAYMDGTLTIEDGDVYDFLNLVVYNMENGPEHWVFRASGQANRLLRWLHQNNPLDTARKNVAHHYDLSRRLYDLFLDEDRQYSCAYYPTGKETLEEAQLAKKRHIAAKLLLKPGQRVLDIGCGWGGMGLYLAEEHDCRVEGITLSTEQLELARERAHAAGLSGQVEFSLRDYRYQEGRYDRIVSVGMFEHVGVQHYDQYFEQVRDLLTDDGVALIHTIGRTSPPGGTNAWLRKYIFPGGYTPALSEVMESIQRTGLVVTDVEVLRLHYAETLRHWRQRFLARRHEAAELYDERFCRMWEFYLAGCEVMFRHSDQVVFQIQIAKRLDAVPITRDYITAEERRRGLRAVPKQAKAAAE